MGVLSHPRNRDVAQEVATAWGMGVPLSVARGVRLPGEAWSQRDWALAQAAAILDKSRCPGCGQPLWLAYDPALERSWVADYPTRCHPCTAIAARAEDYSEATAPNALRFGVKLT